MTEPVAFYRLSGAGNDFLALVEPDRPPGAEEVRAWCRRGLSAGADGLFVLERAGAGAVRMTYHNADGGQASLCINGARCAARLAFELGWAPDGGAVTVETGAGPLQARRAGPTETALEVPPPDGRPRAVELALETRIVQGHHVTVGVPHLVVEWPEGLAEAPVAALGPALRGHPELGAAGANVDFVRYGGDGCLEVRSYERGVEDETLACGTGVLAAVAAGLARGRVTLPARALTRSGFTLAVDGLAEGPDVRRWSLTGDARLIARGHLLPGAATLPAPPEWG
ncbi:MAG: diaminopimelate epimerase [Thermoanaerobaculia bacterium]